MTKVRLAYRTVIDYKSNSNWDKYIFEDTYKEYIIQSQLFNVKESTVTTFRELLNINEKATQLHFLTGLAAQHYVNQLKGNFYSVTDVLGKHFFKFTNYELDIINTDIHDITKHKIGITFYSPLYILLNNENNQYLVTAEVDKKTGFQTLSFQMQPQLTICYYEI